MNGGATDGLDRLHRFVVPAYAASPHLRTCLESLRAQSAPSRIDVFTSTPNQDVEAICREFRIPLHVHGPSRGIGRDWNVALAGASSGLVTIAHQDDIYYPDYAACVLAAASAEPNAALVFTDADEVDEQGVLRQVANNNVIKRVLVGAAYLGRKSIHNGLSRRVLLGLGNAINCPTVAINRSRVPGFRFREDLKTNMDWVAWVELSKVGAIVRVPQRMMAHRVHADSETARCISGGEREREDRMVLESLWPRPVAAAIMRLYRKSYQGYMS